MKKFIITEEDKRHIKSLYEQTTGQTQTQQPQAQQPQTQQPTNNSGVVRSNLSGGIQFVINNNTSLGAGSQLGNVSTQLGQGKFIVFNTVPPAPNTPLMLDFLNTNSQNTAMVSMTTDKAGFMKDSNMFPLNNRGVVDFLALVCRGFYGSVTTDGVVEILKSLRILQQNQVNVLGQNISSNLQSIFTVIQNISTMTGPIFYKNYPTNLVSSKWGASGDEMKQIYNSSIKYFPGNISKTS
jgi:hypothetical protein